jgi:hypothetical protein
MLFDDRWIGPLTGIAGGVVTVAGKAGLLGQSSLSGLAMSRLEVV